jgi:hypothetical protein
MRKSIWLNPPLQRLLEKLGDASAPQDRRSGQFSRRLGDIVERYDIIMKLTPAPELTDDEEFILAEAVCGSMIDILKVKYLQESIEACSVGTPETRRGLAEKVAAWSPAERLAAIESMGQ